MPCCKKKKTENEEVVKDVKTYPGAAIDCADDDKVKHDLVKERTSTLDNNPRDNA